LGGLSRGGKGQLRVPSTSKGSERGTKKKEGDIKTPQKGKKVLGKKRTPCCQYLLTKQKNRHLEYVQKNQKWGEKRKGKEKDVLPGTQDTKRDETL